LPAPCTAEGAASSDELAEAAPFREE